MTSLALACKLNAARTPTSLALRALAAIKRAGGTVLGAGAATPVLGMELVTNGMFDADSAWGKGEGWSISGGSAVRVPSTFGSVLSQSVALVAGKKYLVTYSASITAQGLYVSLAGGTNVDGASRTTSGTYSQELTAASGNNAVWLVTGSAASNLSVDNISVKEILGYTHGNPPVRNYFDSAGTDILDSVTQVDQPVGLVLDGAGTVGPELVTNGTFDSDTSGWTAGPNASIAAVGGELRVTASATNAAAYCIVPTVTGKTYQASCIARAGTSSAAQLRVAGGPTVFTVLTTNTPLSCVFTAASSSTLIDVLAGSSGTFFADNISVREITGNHATQPTTGSKPTLRRGLVNQLLYSQWGGGGTAPTGWAAYGAGGVEGALLPSGMRQRVFTSTASQDFIYQTIALAANTTYTVAVAVDANPGGYVNAALMAAASVPAGATAVTASSGSVASAGSIILITVTTSATAGNMLLRIGTGSQNPTTGSATLSAPALFQGTVTAAQIIAAGGIPLTTTTPSSSALGNYWFQYDPAAPGDFLQTSITTGNEGWVCAGFRPAATGSQAMFSSGATSNVVAGAMLRLDSGTSPQVLVGNGTTRESISDSSFVASVGVPCVLEAGWTASSMFASANGNIGASQAKTVNCTSANTFSVGIATSASFPANGSMSAIVYCPTLPPPADRALIRKWVGSLQGQTL